MPGRCEAVVELSVRKGPGSMPFGFRGSRQSCGDSLVSAHGFAPKYSSARTCELNQSAEACVQVASA